MAAVNYDLMIEQGATFRRVITWRDPSGALVNLTGYRVRFQFRPNAASSIILLDFDSSALATGLTLGALNATGIIDFALSATLTGSLTVTPAVWDLTAISAGGQTDRLLQGAVTLVSGVTR